MIDTDKPWQSPVTWNGQKYDSISAYARSQSISPQLAFYYIKLNRHYKGSKIERI